MSPVASALFTCAIKMDGATERMARMDGELVQVPIPYINQLCRARNCLAPMGTFRTGFTYA